jgi:hypothetical protein
MGHQFFRADTRWDYDHSVHLLRRSLTFPPSRWGQAKPSLSASNMTLARAPLATDDQER